MTLLKKVVGNHIGREHLTLSYNDTFLTRGKVGFSARTDTIKDFSYDLGGQGFVFVGRIKFGNMTEVFILKFVDTGESTFEILLIELVRDLDKTIGCT